jgi:hypothetical protein
VATEIAVVVIQILDEIGACVSIGIVFGAIVGIEVHDDARGQVTLPVDTPTAVNAAAAG